MYVMEFTDVIVRVQSAVAIRALLLTLGFEDDSGGAGWIGMRHSESASRLVLTELPFGTPWALAFAADDMDAAADDMKQRGFRVTHDSATNAPVVVECAGIVLLVYRRRQGKE